MGSRHRTVCAERKIALLLLVAVVVAAPLFGDSETFAQRLRELEEARRTGDSIDAAIMTIGGLAGFVGLSMVALGADAFHANAGLRRAGVVITLSSLGTAAGLLSVNALVFRDVRRQYREAQDDYRIALAIERRLTEAEGKYAGDDDRQVYLRRTYTDREVGAINAGRIFIGMSRGALIECLGEPTDIRTLVDAEGTRERFIYPKELVVTVADGVVTSWEY